MIADQILDHIEQHPHASRHVVSASMVELFYKLRKYGVRADVAKQNFDHLGITFFPISVKDDISIFNSYCSFGYSVEFDYADYFICNAALKFKASHVLTIDRNDIGFALTKAYHIPLACGEVALITFPRND